MKKAFTMIEVIFVIVIIGILASVAIPKLAATRDDAEITDILVKTKILIKDISSFYTAKGKAQYQTAPSQEITNIPLSLHNDCHSVGTGANSFKGKTLWLCVNGIPVLKVGSNDAGLDEYFTLTASNTNTTEARLLKANKVFKSFTNGVIGKDYILYDQDSKNISYK